MISFNVNDLRQAVSPKHSTTALCSRKKRGCPKKVSSALHLDTIKDVAAIDEDSEDDCEDTKLCGAAARVGLVGLGGAGAIKCQAVFGLFRRVL